MQTVLENEMRPPRPLVDRDSESEAMFYIPHYRCKKVFFHTFCFIVSKKWNNHGPFLLPTQELTQKLLRFFA